MAKSGSGSATGTSGNDVQRTRAWTGLWVVVGGDIVIGVAGIVAVARIASSGSGSQAAMVSILTSAFTAIATMTTAYFGIKSMSNTAQSIASNVHSPQQSNGGSPPPADPNPTGGPSNPPG